MTYTNLSFDNISYVRSELMGYAIIGVLIGHILSFSDYEQGIVPSVLNWFSMLIHTNGFLFLSGFGLFFSLSKDSSPKRFYERRFFRFLLPYMLVAVPYFLVVTINKHESIWYYLGCISTIEFWTNGNYHGMWYVAVTLALYILYPPLFVWNTRSRRNVFMKSVFLIFMTIVFNSLLARYCTNYWDKVQIGLLGVPYFFLGSCVPTLVKSQKDYSFIVLSVSTVVYIFAMILGISNPIIGMAKFMVFIMLLSFLFSTFAKNRVMSKLNLCLSWFGRYSLEIYILHLYLWFIIKAIFDFGSFGNIMAACLLSIICCAPMHYVTSRVSEILQHKKN